jgi:ankyrin repeat protein
MIPSKAANLRKYALIFGLLMALIFLPGPRAYAKGDDLVKAAKKGDLTKVQDLLAKGDDVNAKDKKGETALMWAALGGHVEMVQTLLARGADVNAKSHDDATALMAAASNGHREVLEALLAKGADVNARADNGVTALMGAASNSNLEMVQALLAKGADVNARAENGWVALMAAAEKGDFGVVQALLAKGADANARLANGRTELVFSSQYGGVVVNKVRVDQGFSALMLAARNGHLEVVRLLLAAGADVNAKSSNGDTAMMVAAGKGHTEVVQVLLAKGGVAESLPAAQGSAPGAGEPVALSSPHGTVIESAANAGGGRAELPSYFGKFVLKDGTPVKMKLRRTLSSAGAHKGDTVDFEVAEDVTIAGVVVIAKGGSAVGTVTEAAPKGRMGKGGKLNLGVDTVRLIDNEAANLRGSKYAEGGGGSGKSTMASALAFGPALGMFMVHGKDITIAEGTEVLTYVNGDKSLDPAKFPGASAVVAAAEPAPASPPANALVATLSVSSTPPGADIEVDGAYVGSTPSSVGVAAGEHMVKIGKQGFAVWEKKVRVSSGTVNINVELVK